MDLRIIKKEHPNLFRLICENVVCNYEAERWFVAYGTKMGIEIEKENYNKPTFKFNHRTSKQIDFVAIEARKSP